MASLALGWLLLGGPGCALHTSRTGLVASAEGRTELQEPGGRTWRIGRGGEGEVVAGLDGCELRVEGSRLGRRLTVRAWEVRSAPGGGQPCVGRLSLFGSNGLIDDHSTGRKVIVDISGHEELATHEGSVVLVVGYVVGAQTVRPVLWRVVAP